MIDAEDSFFPDWIPWSWDEINRGEWDDILNLSIELKMGEIREHIFRQPELQNILFDEDEDE